jgi:hypothetical protein
VVDRHLVPERLNEPQHREEVVVGDEVLQPVKQDDAAAVRQELLYGEA